jgi:hypothetical protein
LKVDHSQQGASSSGTPPWAADSIRQPREAEKTTGNRGSLTVRNLPLLFTEVTSSEASGSDIPSKGVSGSSIPVDWEPIVLVYHNIELVLPANLRMRVTLCM